MKIITNSRIHDHSERLGENNKAFKSFCKKKTQHFYILTDGFTAYPFI
jgi:hypothetical protein